MAGGINLLIFATREPPSLLTMLKSGVVLFLYPYWEVGRRITEQQTALGWGKSVVENLSRDIQKEFPGIKGFGVRNMWNMARFMLNISLMNFSNH